MSQLIRNEKDFWIGIIYVALGSAAIIISRNYGMGTALKMGPSYFPTILGCLLIVIGVFSLIRSFIKPGSPFGTFAFKGLLLITASIILFGFIVRGAGLVIALPVLVIISSCASIRFRWKYSIVLAAGLTIFCILVFLKALGVPLPILGSWFGG
ncbi:MAG TPA: tripartite tricarboxylate transporter TctB family protein [Methanoregula sp.]|nr:tripartite tricarboxylate transporter TctB family protein [Methanoregula sp.]